MERISNRKRNLTEFVLSNDIKIDATIIYYNVCLRVGSCKSIYIVELTLMYITIFLLTQISLPLHTTLC